MIILLSRDLMATSTVSSTARQMGVQLKSGTSRLLTEIADEEVSLVAIDLGSLDEPVESLLAAIRAKVPNAEIVAFGPHVATDQLERARMAGCERVLARGQFLGQLQQILIVDKP